MQMGDKSPKSKDKSKKQDAAGKNKEKSAANDKANQAAADKAKRKGK